MLVFALGHISERISERVQARLLRSPAQSAGTALGHAATEISLLREEHRAEARVWLAFVAQAAVSKALARTLTANYATLQEAFTRLFRRRELCHVVTIAFRGLVALVEVDLLFGGQARD